VDANHNTNAKMIFKKVNFLLKGNAKRQPTKKRTIIFGG
jgi:hypothetical protein